MNTHEGCADPRAKVQQVIRMAVAAAEEQLGTSIYEHMAREGRAPTRATEWKSFRINQPYCFMKLAGGRWLPLNRLCRPLGIGAGEWWDDYEAYADRAVEFPADPRELSGVWVQQSPTKLWLYSDDPRSLLSYYQRFARLAAAMSPWRAHAMAPAPAA